MRDLRKQREKWLFERARPQVSAWPLGFIDDTGENPDLLISHAEGKYGVEVTELVRNVARAELETRRAICERARRQYIASGGPSGLAVSVAFSERTYLNKSDQIPGAAELFSLVTACVPPGTSAKAKARLIEGVDFSSPLFAAVFLHYLPGHDRDSWQPRNAWRVPILSPGHIQSEIDRKAANLARYLERVSAVWLLLVADSFDASNVWSVDDRVFRTAYASPFTGVVLFEDAMNRATVL